MANQNTDPQNTEQQGGDPQEPKKEVVSLAKYEREKAEWEAERESLKAELANRDKQIEDITAKVGDTEAMQKALDEAKASNEAFKADAEKREAAMRRDFAIDTKLTQMGARNVKAVRAVIPNLDDAQLDDSGDIKGIDFDAIKNDNAYLFADQQRFDTGGERKGGANDGPAMTIGEALAQMGD